MSLAAKEETKLPDLKSECRPPDLANVVSEIARLRVLAQTCAVTDAAVWTRDQQAAFDAETRWCVEALKELAARIAATRS